MITTHHEVPLVPGELHRFSGVLLRRERHLGAEGVVVVHRDDRAAVAGDHPGRAEVVEVVVIGRRDRGA